MKALCLPVARLVAIRGRREVGRSIFSARKAVTGLFGLPPLFAKPSGFPVAAKQAIENINTIRAELLEPRSSISPTIMLQLFDAISNELCKVIDAAEACRNLHTNSEYVEAAQEAFDEISSFIAEINNDPQLYYLIAKMQSRPDLVQQFNREERMFAIDMKKDFEVDGIHLPEEMQERLRGIQAQLTALETAFVQNNMNLSERSQSVVLGPFPRTSEFAQLSSWLHQYEPQDRLDQSRFLLRTRLDRRLTQPILQSVSDESIRKHWWACNILSPVANSTVLADLIRKRHQYAQELGFASHSHRSLRKNILTSPEEVEEVLLEVSRASRARAQQDLQVLSTHKAKIQHAMGLDSSNSSVQPWDITYLQGQVLLSSSNRTPSSEIRNYLSLEACVQSLTDLSSLFGLDVEQVPVPAEEGWLSPTDSFWKAEDGGNDGLVKLVVREKDASGELLGVVYLDLFGRQGKFPGAAHFVVQCRCNKVSLPGISPSPSSVLSTVSGKKQGSWEISPQSAVVVLTFPMDPHVHAQHGLTLRDLENLYHEWGHALHSLCSKTTFQHLSGTRSGTDFIEIPSHVMEYYARDVRWLQRFARHRITGLAPSVDLIASAQHDEGFLGINTQTQLLYAAADQALFGARGRGLASMDKVQDIVLRVNDIVCQAQADFTVLPLGMLHAEKDEGLLTELSRVTALPAMKTVQHLPFMSVAAHTHFVNYGGSYYSYTLAKAYAAQIWQHLFASDPQNTAAGGQFRHGFLAFGATGNDKSVLDGIAGGALDVSHYIRSLGESRS